MGASKCNAEKFCQLTFAGVVELEVFQSNFKDTTIFSKYLCTYENFIIFFFENLLMWQGCIDVLLILQNRSPVQQSVAPLAWLPWVPENPQTFGQWI